MKQLVILSGKGGTGKTTVAAAFAHLASRGPGELRCALADADVDAANFELILHPVKMESHAFMGGSIAVIDESLCTQCGICQQVCRFDAVAQDGMGYRVDEMACEGCASCFHQCPWDAIRMHPQRAGTWYRSDSLYGPLFHAELFPAQENSGKLVTMVKQQARLKALDDGYQAVIVDGPPGIGCPVISAVSGADLAVIVTEPGQAAMHDMHRILETTLHFRVPSVVLINKADIFLEGAQQITAACAEMNIEILGSIPFDETVTHAMLNGEPVTAYDRNSPASQALIHIWQVIAGTLMEEK
jgi:MinD superfamily P-loop ATPase